MASKLGAHVIRSTVDALEWAHVAPAVKALDDTTALRRASSAPVRVYRRYFAEQDIGRSGASVVDEVLAALGDAPATHVELFNETAQRVGQGLERHVELTREAVARLRERRPDLVLVGFCFSTGQPERDDWEYLRLHEYGSASCIGLHAYWGNAGFTLWHALRHRTAHAWTAGDHPPFLISETGRDRVEGGRGGWRADGLTEDAYAAELAAYDAELLADPYVIAAVPFSSGPTPDWAAFDVDPLASRLIAATGPLPPPPEEPMPEPTETLEGVDCSNWQREVAWERVAAAGRAFAIVKSSEDPSYRDPFFGANWRAIRGAGLTRGVYHFARPSRVDPAASVELLVDRLDAVGGLEAGDLVALDLEDTDVAPDANLGAWTLEWLERAEAALGVRPLLYSGVWFMAPHGLLEESHLAAYPLWLADYQTEPPEPPLPWTRLAIWQYSASGSLPGIAGDADLDRFFGTAADLAAIGYAGAAPAPSDPLEAVQAETWALLDQVQAAAASWEALGWPSAAAGIGAAAEAAKSIVRASKLEK